MINLVPKRIEASQTSPCFIDLFSGCGGLSLGLSMAGWRGVFSVEKSPDAFATFKTNLCDAQNQFKFLPTCLDGAELSTVFWC